MTPLTIAPTRRLIAAACTALAALAPHGAARAEVVRFEVLQSAPAFEGRSFGSVGSYVKITARATIAVDPGDPRNAVIADIDRAPRNAQGRVEATTDVVILRPADAARGNGTLLLDVPNRGRKLAPQLFDDAQQPGANVADKATDAGLGFTHAEGYTMVWVGWQADMPSLPNQHALAAPVLRGVTGPSRDEFLFDHTRSPLPPLWRGRSPTRPRSQSPCARAGTRRARSRPACRSAPPAPTRSKSRARRAASMPRRCTK